MFCNTESVVSGPTVPAFKFKDLVVENVFYCRIHTWNISEFAKIFTSIVKYVDTDNFLANNNSDLALS